MEAEVKGKILRMLSQSFAALASWLLNAWAATSVMELAFIVAASCIGCKDTIFILAVEYAVLHSQAEWYMNITLPPLTI